MYVCGEMAVCMAVGGGGDIAECVLVDAETSTETSSQGLYLRASAS